MDRYDEVGKGIDVSGLDKKPSSGGQRRIPTGIYDASKPEHDKFFPYAGEQYTPEKGIRTGVGNTHTRSATDVSGSEKKAVASPPPAFPSKVIGPRQTYMERHTDMGRWNAAKETAKAVSELRVVEIENEELKKQYDKIRKEKIEAERENKELQRDNKEMSGKIVEQVEWIQGQMERNHSLSTLLKNAKTFFGAYNKKLWVANQEFKELGKYILAEKDGLKRGNSSCGCASNYSESLERIASKLGVLIKSTEEASEENPQNYIDKLIQELNKEMEVRPNKKRTTSGLIGKPNHDPLKEMKIKIEELKDEVKFGTKWKSMYMELLTDKTIPLPLPPEEFENELAQIKNQAEYEKANAIKVLKKEIDELKEETTKSKNVVANKETTVESLKVELKTARDDAGMVQEQNKQLKDQLRTLKDQKRALMEQIKLVTEKNTTLKEQVGALREQVESLMQENSILKANEINPDDYSRIKAENNILKLRVTELEIGVNSPLKDNECKADCRAMLLLLNSLVVLFVKSSMAKH